jgi:hypothetical protein
MSAGLAARATSRTMSLGGEIAKEKTFCRLSLRSSRNKLVAT